MEMTGTLFPLPGDRARFVVWIACPEAMSDHIDRRSDRRENRRDQAEVAPQHHEAMDTTPVADRQREQRKPQPEQEQEADSCLE